MIPGPLAIFIFYVKKIGIRTFTVRLCNVHRVYALVIAVEIFPQYPEYSAATSAALSVRADTYVFSVSEPLTRSYDDMVTI